MVEHISKINIILSRVLKIGAYLAIALMVLGLVLFKGGFSIDTSILGLNSVFRGVFQLNPLALMTIGLLVLILTPVLRVLAAALTFLLIEKDRKYFFISAGVFIILMISILLAYV